MTTIDQKTSVEYSKSRVEHLQGGIKKENLISSEQKVNTEDISKKILIAEESNLIKSESESAIVESQLQDKKKTWIDKFSFLNSTILTTQLYQIMDQESTSREKDLKPFWNQQSKEIIEEVVVTHKDRLCRFGFDLIEGIIKEHSNGKIVVLNQEKTSPEKELIDDLISIITVFSSRLYGLRSNSIKNKIRTQIKNSQNQVITIESREETDTTNVRTVEMVL